MMELIDTHAHIDAEEFDSDRGDVLARAREAGVVAVVTFGDSMASSERCAALARENEMVYAGAGVHPENIFRLTEEDEARIRALAAQEKVVAIGEVGLDYYWEKDEEMRALQRDMLIRFLAIAREFDMPVCIHDREAHGDMMRILKNEGRLSRGVIHCFSGSAEMARELLRMGWYLGFDGPVTYKNAVKALDVLKNAPADRILVETDAPYLSPVPHRGKRNEPAYVRLTAQKAAEVRGETLESFAERTSANARELYGIR